MTRTADGKDLEFEKDETKQRVSSARVQQYSNVQTALFYCLLCSFCVYSCSETFYLCSAITFFQAAIYTPHILKYNI